MKKKIALLLAAIMTMSLMPTTIFASSANKITRTLSSVPAKTALVLNDTVLTKPVLAGADRRVKRGGAISSDVIENFAVAPKLSMRLDAGMTLSQNTAFRIQLENAKWMLAVGTSTGAIVGNTIALKDLAQNSSLSANGGSLTSISSAGYAYDATASTTSNVSDIPFNFTISEADETVATVTFPKAWNNTNQPYLTIPLPIYVEKEGITVKAKVTSNSSEFSSGEFVVVASSAGSTVNSFRTIETGREEITLGTLAIEETRIGSIDTSGAIRIAAPAGYDFSNDPSQWTFISESGARDDAAPLFTDVMYKEDSNSSDVYYLYFNGVKESNVIPGAIYVKNIKIAPVDEDNIPFGKTITVNLQRYTPSTSDVAWRVAGTGAKGSVMSLNGKYSITTAKELPITTGAINAAKPVDWTVSLTAETPKEIVSGRYADYADSDEHVTAEVTFEEQEVGAWLSGRTTDFVLPEGVKIRGIEYTELTNIATGSKPLDLLNEELGKSGNDSKFIDNVVTYQANKFSLKGIALADPTDTALIKFKLYLSVDPNYAKDTITLTASGTGVQDKIAPVTIAKVKRPVTVTAKSTDVQIGYQKYAVNDITLTENVAGAIKKISGGTKGLAIALYDGQVSTDLQFNTIDKSQITTTGDIKVTLNSVSYGVVYLDVDRTSTVPSTIKFTGLEVKVNRNVPYGSYDLVLFGDSVFGNYEKIATGSLASISNRPSSYLALTSLVGFGENVDGFVTKDYIKVATVGSEVQKVNTFKVQDGSKTVIINGETSTIPVSPYISKATNRFMLPVRYMAVLLGVDEKDIVYSDVTKTVTVMMPTRTIQFVTGSDILTIASNGVSTTVKMDAKAENTDGRVYVPVKAVADAYGAKLAYDDATKTATFN